MREKKHNPVKPKVAITIQNKQTKTKKEIEKEGRESHSTQGAHRQKHQS